MADRFPAELPMRFTTTSDGVRIAYAVVGEGPTTIFAWGPGATHQQLMWTFPTLRRDNIRLCAGQRGLFFDWRNTGLSGSTGKGFTLDTGVLDLSAVVEAAGPGPVSLYCGGAAAMPVVRYAAANPDRVSRIAMFAGQVSPTRNPPRSWRAWRDMVADEPDMAVKVMTRMATSWADDSLVEWEAYWRRCSPLEYHEQVIEYVAHLDVRDDVPRINCPVLVVQSRDATVPSLEEATELAAAFPKGRLMVIAGHSITLTGAEEDPIPAIVEFLTEGATRGNQGEQSSRITSRARESLSSRELDVLALVAAGKTNGEIADALTIAPATASRHVHNILEKLGMSRRSEAAWWASHGNGLLK